MLMYADDTTLYCNLNGVNSEIKINNELSKISEWLSSNKLSLNIKKTKFMVFQTPQRRVDYPVLKLNNVNIEMSVSVQFSWSCYKFHIEMGQTYSTYIFKKFQSNWHNI